jgi:RNA polymerase sigma-70 factor (ECF subfamily)
VTERRDASSNAERAVRALVDDLFRRESAHLVAALVRVLGPANLALVEDVVHDALVSAMQAWRFGAPDNPRAWLLQVARNRAIDLLRRERRRVDLAPDGDADAALAADRATGATVESALGHAVDLALSPDADARNQLAMMFSICDRALSPETHVTLILRLLCGLSAGEIARAFLVDVATIDRRLHRGRARLAELGQLCDARDDLRARQPSVEHALYLMFNEGYHGADVDSPLHPAMCADALQLAELLLDADAIDPRSVHALAALFCCNAARLATRLDAGGAIVPLADQDRARWDRGLVERGVQHLAAAATGDRWTRWHLEAGIAFEHSRAASLADTDWAKIAAYYDALAALAPGPVVAMNRALAIAELHGVDAGIAALAPLAGDARLARYSFYWAARADLERRAGRPDDAAAHYRRAIALAASRAERMSYERRLAELASPAGASSRT